MRHPNLLPILALLAPLLAGLGQAAPGAAVPSIGAAPGRAVGAPAPVGAGPATAKPAADAKARAEMNVPHAPFRIYGNTYFVGTNGLSSILIDGDLQESVPNIVSNIRALGFRLEDIKLILNSHDHHDHAGGIAELQKRSGAKVAASKLSAHVLSQGHADPNDPQFATQPPIPAVRNVQVIKDGETLKVGPNSITAHFTPGHTPGSTSWTWKACEKSRCRLVVYADSLTPVSAEGFLFSNNKGYPTVVDDFHKSFAVLKNLPCDILLTPHPGQSDMWPRLDAATRIGDTEAWVDPTACQRYAEKAEVSLNKRLADEVRR